MGSKGFEVHKFFVIKSTVLESLKYLGFCSGDKRIRARKNPGDTKFSSRSIHSQWAAAHAPRVLITTYMYTPTAAISTKFIY